MCASSTRLSKLCIRQLRFPNLQPLRADETGADTKTAAHLTKHLTKSLDLRIGHRLSLLLNLYLSHTLNPGLKGLSDKDELLRSITLSCLYVYLFLNYLVLIFSFFLLGLHSAVLPKQIRSHRGHLVTKTALDLKGEVGFGCLSMDGLKYLFLEDRDQPLPSWMAELEDILECPVCLKTFLDPPIHQCENGHCFCTSCHEPLQRVGDECPVCRGRLTNTRNLKMEQLLGKLPQTKCRYEDCQFKRAEVDVVHQHETDCLFRLVECAFCQDGIPLSKLPDHLHIDHKKKSITLQGFGEEKEMYGGKLYNGQVELKCNNLTFFLN